MSTTHTTKCKRCGFEGVYWNQSSATGKWILYEKNTYNKHFCQDDKLKAVKCKYCRADDLHWAEEVDPNTQLKKAVLTESYGLPHSCDERISFAAKEKQGKKDRYSAEKERVAAMPDGLCTQCRGTGLMTDGNKSYCSSCRGYGSFSDQGRKWILASMRRELWPGMKEDGKFNRKGYK